jgi:hypothetical protein
VRDRHRGHIGLQQGFDRRALSRPLVPPQLHNSRSPLDLTLLLRSLCSRRYFRWKQQQPQEAFQAILDQTAYKYTSLCRFCQRFVDERDGLLGGQ